jgi:hypothetical protein
MSIRSLLLPVILLVSFTETFQTKIIHVSAGEPTIPIMTIDNSTKLSSVQGEIELTVCYEVVPGGEISFDVTLINPEPTQETFQVTLLVVPPVGEPRTLYDNVHTLPGSTQVTKSITVPVPSALTNYGIFSFELYIDSEYADGFQCENNSRDNIEIRWDNGVVGDFFFWYNPGDTWAVRGCFPEEAILDLVGVRILSEDDPYWPWPDAIHQAIEIHVYDDDGPEGLPGTLIYNSGDVYVNPSTGYASAYPGILLNGTFYIGNCQLTSYPTCEAQAVDDSCHYPDEMFQKSGGVWSNVGDQYGGDFMIWGVGHIP